MIVLVKAIPLFLGLLAAGGAVNVANSEDPSQYKDPEAVINSVVDSVTDGYKNGQTITQEVYEKEYND